MLDKALHAKSVEPDEVLKSPEVMQAAQIQRDLDLIALKSHAKRARDSRAAYLALIGKGLLDRDKAGKPQPRFGHACTASQTQAESELFEIQALKLEAESALPKGAALDAVDTFAESKVDTVVLTGKNAKGKAVSRTLKGNAARAVTSAIEAFEQAKAELQGTRFQKRIQRRALSRSLRGVLKAA